MLRLPASELLGFDGNLLRVSHLPVRAGVRGGRCGISPSRRFRTTSGASELGDQRPQTGDRSRDRGGGSAAGGVINQITPETEGRC